MKEYILGTDWWDDCDDVVAVRILARAHKEGRIRLKAVAINVYNEYSVPSLDGFLKLENVQNIPIGIDKEATDFEGRPTYQKRLKEYAVDYSSDINAEDGVRLYRRILAGSSEKLEIVEIGYLQIVANVLMSKPDDISDKNGLELVKEKVSKIWVMAGKWDGDGEQENNFSRNSRAKDAAEKFCRLCPVPVTFLGFEVGVDVITGDELDKEDFLYKAMCDHGAKNGRNSWDPMLVQLAIIGDEELAGYHVVEGKARVDKATGANYFEAVENGNHKYVVRKYPASFYKEKINKLIHSSKAQE